MCVVRNDLRHTKINQLNHLVLLVRREDAVFGLYERGRYLQVTVNDAALMQVADGVYDGADHATGFHLGVDFLLAYLLVELSAREEF